MEEKIEKLLKEVIENLGYELYDVIYEKEAKDYYLRIFIDKPEGISLEDCEKVNDAISDLLDEANYIKDQYFLEVSSPGVERLLRKDKHLQANLRHEVTVSLFKPIKLENNDEEKPNKKPKSQKEKPQKQLEGILKQFDQNKITLQLKNEEIQIPRKDISNIKLKYNW